MARYQLYLKDQVMYALLQEKIRTGKSVGRLINEILEDWCRRRESAGLEPAIPICVVCGKPATFQWFGMGRQSVFVCRLHKYNVKGLKGLRTLTR